MTIMRVTNEVQKSTSTPPLLYMHAHILMPNLWWFMNGISLAPSTFLYIELYFIELPNSNKSGLGIGVVEVHSVA
jgi:hypothetical protein